MWTSGDADAIARYEALPAPLRLQKYLGLVDPEPTGWVSVLRSDVSEGVHSTLTSIMIEPEFGSAALDEAAWSCDDLGSSWNDLRGDLGFIEGLVADDGYPMHFFGQAREHHGLVAPTIEFTPSFVWWLGLVPAGDGQWSRIDKAGRSHDVVRTKRLEDDGYDVSVDANYLRRYLAARGMFLVIQHRHTVWANLKDVEPIHLAIRNEVVTLEFRATSAIGGTKRNFFADLLGKHIVLPFDQPGADPDDNVRPPRYQEFITGVDRQTGQPIRTSCGDDTREGGAHFLTPVFFDPDVLTRYREDNTRYVLSRTRLWCLDLWGLDIDINDEELVQVWLGDMRRLPESERDHWVVHNVVPRGGVSEIRFRRDILNQWVTDDRPDLQNLRRAKSRLNDIAHKVVGSDLFRPLGKHDREAFEGLSLCTNSSVAQRDVSILTLAKGVVECLDVKLLRGLAGTTEPEPSLNCLQAWITTLGGDAEELCKPLRLLQDLRSTGSSHMKGSKYDGVIASAGWESTPPDKQFQQLVDEVTHALQGLANLIDSTAS